jgi:hypothetical protein
MPQHTPDHADHSRDHDDDATVLPLRATRSATQDTWNVERVDTEPMTAQQYDSAVSALAALITQWRANQENATEAHEKAA